MPEADVLYRYADRVAVEGFFADDTIYSPPDPSRVSIDLLEFPVLSRTRCGAWIRPGGQRKFVLLKGTRKKFACETKEEALESFLARKRSQVGRLRFDLTAAETALARMEATIGMEPAWRTVGVMEALRRIQTAADSIEPSEGRASVLFEVLCKCRCLARDALHGDNQWSLTRDKPGPGK